MENVQPTNMLSNEELEQQSPDNSEQQSPDNLESHNTERQIRYAISRLEAFAKFSRTSLEEVEKGSSERLDKLLSQFYAGLRKKSGELYTKKSMQAIRYGLQRHFQACKELDICDKTAFKESNRTYKAMMVRLKDCGKSTVKHKKTVSREDMTKIQNSLDIRTPEGLQNKVFLDVMIHFTNGGRENLRSMTVSDYTLEVDERKQRYIMYHVGTSTKLRHGEEDMPPGSRMYEIPDSDRCPVKTFLAFAKVLNPNEKCMWQRPNPLAPLDGLPWYLDAPLGVNTLGDKMRKIAERAGCTQRYTNHSLKATSSSVLYGAGSQDDHSPREVPLGHSLGASVTVEDPLPMNAGQSNLPIILMTDGKQQKLQYFVVPQRQSGSVQEAVPLQPLKTGHHVQNACQAQEAPSQTSYEELSRPSMGQIERPLSYYVTLKDACVQTDSPQTCSASSQTGNVSSDTESPAPPVQEFSTTADREYGCKDDSVEMEVSIDIKLDSSDVQLEGSTDQHIPDDGLMEHSSASELQGGDRIVIKIEPPDEDEGWIEEPGNSMTVIPALVTGLKQSPTSTADAVAGTNQRNASDISDDGHKVSNCDERIPSDGVSMPGKISEEALTTARPLTHHTAMDTSQGRDQCKGSTAESRPATLNYTRAATSSVQENAMSISSTEEKPAGHKKVNENYCHIAQKHYYYKRTSNRQSWDKGQMKLAVQSVTNGDMGYAVAASQFHVPETTLRRKVKAHNEAQDINVPMGRKVTLTTQVEKELHDHILLLKAQGFGYTKSELQKLCYDFVTAKNIPNVFSKQLKVAGRKWLNGFLTRHPDISYRKTKGLSRACRKRRLKGKT